MEEVRIGLLLKQLKIILEQYCNEDKGKLDITLSQCCMLCYLISRDSRELYAVDIHKELNISRASVSVILKYLKNKGYLTMEGDFQDERKKRILLTRKAYEMQGEIEKNLKRREECLCEGIPEGDLKLFGEVLDRMVLNLKKEISETEVKKI